MRDSPLSGRDLESHPCGNIGTRSGGGRARGFNFADVKKRDPQSFGPWVRSKFLAPPTRHASAVALQQQGVAKSSRPPAVRTTACRIFPHPQNEGRPWLELWGRVKSAGGAVSGLAGSENSARPSIRWRIGQSHGHQQQTRRGIARTKATRRIRATHRPHPEAKDPRRGIIATRHGTGRVPRLVADRRCRREPDPRAVIPAGARCPRLAVVAGGAA